jgi:hypothetical protein
MFAAIDAANEQIRAAHRSTNPATQQSMRGRRVTGPATCHRIWAMLRVALNDVVADGLIPTNPVTAVRLQAGAAGPAAGVDRPACRPVAGHRRSPRPGDGLDTSAGRRLS